MTLMLIDLSMKSKNICPIFIILTWLVHELFWIIFHFCEEILWYIYDHFLQFKDMHVPGITILNLITKHVLYRNVYCIIIGYKLYLCF